MAGSIQPQGSCPTGVGCGRLEAAAMMACGQIDRPVCGAAWDQTPGPSSGRGVAQISWRKDHWWLVRQQDQGGSPGVLAGGANGQPHGRT